MIIDKIINKNDKIKIDKINIIKVKLVNYYNK